MKSVVGKVDSIEMYPGRPDMLKVELEVGQHYFFQLSDKVTCDAQSVDVATLFAWLAGHRDVSVKLHPSVELYGLSLKTEFTSK